MAQNYRNQSGRSDYGRGGHHQAGSDRDRYRTGGEQRYNPEWDDRNQSRGFEGNRSYSQGGYSEEFGYRRGQARDQGRDEDHDYGASNYQSRGSLGSSYQGGRRNEGDFGREGQARYDQGRFDEANRWSEGASRDEFDDLYGRERSTTSSWHEDPGDRGSYFGTGSYIDDGGASRGFGSDFERARRQVQQRFGSGSQGRGTSGDYSNYGRSYYGSQSGSGRDEQPWRGQRGPSYQERSGWEYGSGPRSASGSQGVGAYDYDSDYRSDYGSYVGSQSHRGRGPQGYQRSDERLKEMICERLTDDPMIDASNITVDVTSQVVKLTGTVDDRSTKYEVEELVERLGGVKDIDNQLRVQSTQSNWNQPTSQSTASGQVRGGSDWEAGSSSLPSSGTTAGRSTSASSTSTGSTAPGSSSSKRN